MQPDVTVDVADLVAVVEIHRPPNNFFDADLVGALADAIESAEANPDVRAIVLCSEGKNFCAGAALGSGDGDPSRTPLAVYRQGLRLFTGTRPIVAAVQGAAVGGGLGLALAADFRVATPESRFHCNFSRLGFHHGFGVTVTLPAVVGQQRALKLLYTGGQVRGDDRAPARPVRPDRLTVGSAPRGARPGGGDRGQRAACRPVDPPDDAGRPRRADAPGDGTGKRGPERPAHNRGLRRGCPGDGRAPAAAVRRALTRSRAGG